uniref:RNA-dependent RNA polymerase n=1 Tax=Annperkins narna-like virus TaxID=2716639 RepID=A0A6G7PS86_9VIRU|nr:RNA-dependent RNA polymerase [Annperkins narna-like virus]
MVVSYYLNHADLVHRLTTYLLDFIVFSHQRMKQTVTIQLSTGVCRIPRIRKRPRRKPRYPNPSKRRLTTDQPKKLDKKLWNKFYLLKKGFKVSQFLKKQNQLSEQLTSYYFEQVKVMVINRGWRDMITRIKNTRVAFLRYLGGEPLEHIPQVSLSRSGFPLWLNRYKEELLTKVELSLTLLTMCRGLNLSPVPNFSPITDSWNGSDTISPREFRKAIQSLGIKRKNLNFRRFHTSTKSGPHGQATITSGADLEDLPPEMEECILVLGGEKLKEKINRLKSDFPYSNGKFSTLNQLALSALSFDKTKTKSMRKLSYFDDGEGKVRVIAVLDYWSQTCLKPIHDHLMNILKGLETDCTFNQSAFLPRVPNDGRTLYSLDLTNATDRMPLIIQERLLSVIIGKRKAEAWSKLLTHWPYECEGKYYSYNTGQPMGAYSSWPSMALTHHLLVQVSSIRGTGKSTKEYCLLGDDILIWNDSVATEYKKLLRELDMPISLVKTHQSSKLCEFAKRWLYNGKEISPFSLKGLIETWKRYPLLASFLQTQHNHGWRCQEEERPGILQTCFSISGRHQQGKRLSKLGQVFWSILDLKETGDFSGHVVRTCRRVFGFPGESPDDVSLEKEKFTSLRVSLLQGDLSTLDSDFMDYYNRSKPIVLSGVTEGTDPHTVHSLLRETYPLQSVVYDMRGDTDEIIFALICADPAEVTWEKLGEWDGFVSNFITRTIYSLQKHKAISLQLGAFVKGLLTSFKG